MSPLVHFNLKIVTIYKDGLSFMGMTGLVNHKNVFVVFFPNAGLEILLEFLSLSKFCSKVFRAC